MLGEGARKMTFWCLIPSLPPYPSSPLAHPHDTSCMTPLNVKPSPSTPHQRTFDRNLVALPGAAAWPVILYCWNRRGLFLTMSSKHFLSAYRVSRCLEHTDGLEQIEGFSPWVTHLWELSPMCSLGLWWQLCLFCHCHLDSKQLRRYVASPAPLSWSPGWSGFLLHSPLLVPIALTIDKGWCYQCGCWSWESRHLGAARSLWHLFPLVFLIRIILNRKIPGRKVFCPSVLESYVCHSKTWQLWVFTEFQILLWARLLINI